LLPTQTLEYWLLSYVFETATVNANLWNEDILPCDWLLNCFEITIKTANAIVSGVPEDYLKKQTPRYWVEDWIKQQNNQPSSEFISFIENSNENELVSYGNELHP